MVEKATDIMEIAGYGVFGTPAVVMDVSLTMLLLYGVLGGFLLGVGRMPVPWQALANESRPLDN